MPESRFPRRRDTYWMSAVVLLATSIALMVPGGPGRERSAAEPAYPGQRQPTTGFGGSVGSPDKVVKFDLSADVEQGKPLVPGSFADPFIMEEEKADYAYATNTNSANIPVMRFPHGGSEGEYLGDAMPTLPSWTTKGFQWAPAVWARPDGKFVLFYATPAASGSDRQCISAAVSDSPAGPFTDSSDGPFICPLSEGGAIDPSPFITEDGQPHLLWKADGNCCGLATTIYSQALSSDGLSIDGEPTALISATQSWENGIVEAPSMVQVDSTHYLFYSGNDWNTADYAIGLATCSSLTGPCSKPLDDPWQASAAEARGPGGQEFFDRSDRVWMVHHGWLPDEVDTSGAERRLFLDVVAFDEGSLPRKDDTDISDDADVSDDSQAGTSSRWIWLAVGGLAVGALAVATWEIRRRSRPEE